LVVDEEVAVQTALRSSGIALAATGSLFATVASAHLHRPISFAPLTRSGDHSRVFAARPPRLSAAMEISRRSALLDGRLPWVPAPIFEMFDVFQFESFDPKTGDCLLYAKVAPGTPRDSAVR
jgi:hypothetical protein